MNTKDREAERAAIVAEGLTDAQREMLERICASNGGGVRAKFNYRNEPQPPFAKLYDLDLIQGKSGWQDRAVHTPFGRAVRAHLQGKDHD